MDLLASVGKQFLVATRTRVVHRCAPPPKSSTKQTSCALPNPAMKPERCPADTTPAPNRNGVQMVKT